MLKMQKLNKDFLGDEDIGIEGLIYIGLRMG